MSSPSLFLEARQIVKRYPGNVALDHVDLRLHRGAVNVLIGENGAGKSTLMRILSGVEQCDEGAIEIEGQPVFIRSPRDASAPESGGRDAELHAIRGPVTKGRAGGT